MTDAHPNKAAPETPIAISATNAAIWVSELLSTVEKGSCAFLDDVGEKPVACVLREGFHPPSVGPGDDKPFLLVRTSGTTGNAKHFLRSWASWERCFRAEARYFGLQASDRILTVGSPFFSLTPYGLLRSVHLGAQAGHLPQPTAAASRSLGEKLKPTVIYGPPSGVLSYAQACRSRNVNGTLRLVLCGGVRLSEEQYDTLQGLCPNARIIDFYGAAETSFIAIQNRSSDSRDATLFPGVMAQIAPSGRLMVKTPYAAMAQVSGPSDLSRHRPVTDVEGWITLDDLAELRPENGLRLLGRADGALNIAGRLVSVESIEAELETIQGVEQALVFAVPDGNRGVRTIALLAISDQSAVPERAILRKRLRSILPSSAIPRTFLRAVAPLPLGGPGKPDRVNLRSAYLDGTLPAEEIA